MSWIVYPNLPSFLEFDFENMKMRQPNSRRVRPGGATWDLKRDEDGNWHERSDTFPQRGWSPFFRSADLEDTYREHKKLPEKQRSRDLNITVRTTCECTNSDMEVINRKLQTLKGAFQREINHQLGVILGVNKCRG